MDEITELKRIWEQTEQRLSQLNNHSKTYIFWLYDVWGNSEEGYNVNDRTKCQSVTIQENSDDYDILQILEDENIINRENDKDVFSVDECSDDSTIEINIGDDEKPFGQLVEDDSDNESFDDFMVKVLDITRTQYLSSGKWTTKDYTIVIGTGGPHVEFTTNYQINVYWGGKSQEFTTYDDNARATIDRVCEYLDDCYPEE